MRDFYITDKATNSKLLMKIHQFLTSRSKALEFTCSSVIQTQQRVPTWMYEWQETKRGQSSDSFWWYFFLVISRNNCDKQFQLFIHGLTSNHSWTPVSGRRSAETISRSVFCSWSLGIETSKSFVNTEQSSSDSVPEITVWDLHIHCDRISPQHY